MSIFRVAILSGISVSLLYAAPAVAITIPTIMTGCHPITAQEIAALRATGTTIPANGQFCDKDKPLLYGSACPESPYPYLQSKNKTGRPDAVSGLNSDFACRLAKFIKAAASAGHDITIGSGYRSIAHQASLYQGFQAAGGRGAPVAAPGKSRHNYGIAADIRYNGQHSNFGAGARNTQICIERLPACKWAHQNAASLGLRYPMAVEPWHIEPSGSIMGGSPQSDGYFQSDLGSSYSGTPFLTPLNNSLYPPPPPPPPPSSPTSMSTPSSQSTQPGFPSSPQNISDLLSRNLQTNNPLPSPISELLNRPAPESGSVPTSTSTPSQYADPEEPREDVSDILKRSGSNATSALDLIREYAGETGRSIETSTSAPVTLNPDLGNSTNISSLGSSSGFVASGTIVYSEQPLNAPHTFTSEDLGRSPFATQSERSAALRVLDSLRSFLTWTLQIITFGSYGR